MCEILGILGLNNATEFLDLQNHRGPTNTGIWGESKVFLRYKRLAILDLNSLSNQPFQLGKNIIIFNSEIKVRKKY
tara:strand:- start:921 stop:1148 length:228 start_codon:yes stop_codon:yes gene_type:complete